MDLHEKRYFAYPNSLDPVTPVYKKGMIVIGLSAVLSLISVTVLLVFITHRLVSWRKHYKEYVGYNQYVILIYNLLLADLQQSIAFAISFHWLRIDKIVAPTAPCFIQGWFLHIGDVTSGFFVLAIAIHTWLAVVRGYKMPYVWFVLSIAGIWLFGLFLTILGPIMHKDRFFTRAGGWVSTSFTTICRQAKFSYSAGYQPTSSQSVCGFTISGFSLSSLAPSPSMVTSLSTYADAYVVS